MDKEANPNYIAQQLAEANKLMCERNLHKWSDWKEPFDTTIGLYYKECERCNKKIDQLGQEIAILSIWPTNPKKTT